MDSRRAFPEFTVFILSPAIRVTDASAGPEITRQDFSMQQNLS